MNPPLEPDQISIIDPVVIKKKKKKPRMSYCACGNQAFRRSCGEWACERCIKIEATMSYDTGRVGIRHPDFDKTDWYETDLPA